MAQTPNFDITEVAASQNQKEVTINTGFVELEAALSNFLAVAMPDADYTLTTGEGGQALGNVAFQFTGVITADRHVIVPANKKLYLVMNNTSTSLGFNLIVKTPSGTGVIVAPNNSRYTWVYCDGTNVVAAGPGAGAGSGTVTNNEGALTANEVIIGTGGDDVQALGSIGTNGEVLTSQGPGLPPIWAAGGGGGGGSAIQSLPLQNVVYGYKSGNPGGLGNFNGPNAVGDVISSTGAASLVNAQAPTSAHGPGTNLTTSGTGTAAFLFGDNLYRVGRSVKIMGKLWLSRTTDTRFLFGVTVSTSGDDSDNPIDYCALFRYSTIAGDVNFQCLTGNAATTTVTDTGVVADTNEHTFAISFDDVTPEINFYIDGNLVGTISTTLPAVGQNLAYTLAIRGNSTNNTAGFGQIVIQSNF